MCCPCRRQLCALPMVCNREIKQNISERDAHYYSFPLISCTRHTRLSLSLLSERVSVCVSEKSLSKCSSQIVDKRRNEICVHNNCRVNAFSHFLSHTLSPPRLRRGYPLNLSISVSGGKETNRDSLSRGDRKGKSPAHNLPRHPACGGMLR